MNFSEALNSKWGKAVTGLVTVAALVLAGLVIANSGAFGGDSGRKPTAQQLRSDAEAQMAAIDKMSNLTPEQKAALKAHEEGQIKQAQSASGSRMGEQPPSATNH